MMYNYVFGLMFLFGLFVFMSMRKHIFITLMALEYMGLCIYMYIVMMMLYYMSDMYIILVFLTFMVCEAVLGLSIMICMIRFYGNDNVNTLSLVW